MILDNGTKVLIVHRRLYEQDHARYFVGTVDGYEQGIAKVNGFTWVYDALNGVAIRKNDERTKIFSIASGTLIVYELSNSIDPAKIRLTHEADGRFLMRDGQEIIADLGESHLMIDPKRAKRKG